MLGGDAPWSGALLEDLSQADVEGRSTPLHAALSGGHAEVVRVIISCIPDGALRRYDP